jgi:hypothetical protein
MKREALTVFLAVCPLCGTVLAEDDADYGVIESYQKAFFRWHAPPGVPVCPRVCKIFGDAVILRAERAACLSHVDENFWDFASDRANFAEEESACFEVKEGGGSDLFLVQSDSNDYAVRLEAAFYRMIGSAVFPKLAIGYLVSSGWYDSHVKSGRSTDDRDGAAVSTKRRVADGFLTLLKTEQDGSSASNTQQDCSDDDEGDAS